MLTLAAHAFLGEYTPADLTLMTRATAVVTSTAAAYPIAVIGNEVSSGGFMSYDGQ